MTETAQKSPKIGILSALQGVMEDVGSIGKDRQNQQQHYSFRGIDDVYNAVQPALIKRGVIIAPSVRDMQREERQTKAGGTLIYTTVTVDYVFRCVKDGSEILVSTIGEGMDSSDKSANKAMSAAFKYAVFQTLCIPTEGQHVDSERESPAPAPKQGGDQPAKKATGTTAAPDATQQKPDYKEFLAHMAEARKYVGNVTYYAALKQYGREHANEFRGADEMAAILADLRAAARAKKGKTKKEKATA